MKHSVVNVATPLSEEAAEEDAVALASVEELNEEERKKPLALIVDDNEDFVSFMRYTLSLYFRIESAETER